MAAIWQSEYVRALFENQLNVILPRPQLPEPRPHEQAVRSQSPEQTDYRAPLSQYRPLSSHEKSQRQDLHGTLKDSGAFKDEYSFSKHELFVLRAGGTIGVADILHISKNHRKAIYRKVAVNPSDDAKETENEGLEDEEGMESLAAELAMVARDYKDCYRSSERRIYTSAHNYGEWTTSRRIEVGEERYIREVETAY